MSPAPDRTLHAQQALALSELFDRSLGSEPYGTRRPRRLKLSKPDGPSTAGGRVARQNLVLVPDEGGSPIVVGWLDAANKRAELRTFRMLGKQFEARYGRGIDLEHDAYEQLERELESFFQMQGFELARADAHTVPIAPDAVVETGPRESSGPMIGMLGLGVALGIGIGYLLFG